MAFTRSHLTRKTHTITRMQINLTLSGLAALAGIMVVGASVPSVSVFAVVTRSATLGFAHGALTSLGIVVGDVTFILLAIYGLSLLADVLGAHFALIKYLGGAYLIWLGITLGRSTTTPGTVVPNSRSSAASSFMTGLLITLADQKAILFYLGFLPAFVDLTAVTWTDTSVILITAVAAVGAPKLVYALIGHAIRPRIGKTSITRAINLIAASVMIGVGVYLFVKA